MFAELIGFSPSDWINVHLLTQTKIMQRI